MWHDAICVTGMLAGICCAHTLPPFKALFPTAGTPCPTPCQGAQPSEGSGVTDARAGRRRV